MTKPYITVEGKSVYEFVEKKSKFIGHVKFVETEEAAFDFINNIKAKHWGAKHNVYAYSLKDNNICRYSDDGEPHGTAGVPVLDVIKKKNLQNVVAVVTRYFGGVLLGTGGLVRAYSKAVIGAIDLANIVKMSLCCECEVVFSYGYYGKFQNILSKYLGVIDDVNFAQDVKVFFHIEKENFPLLLEKIKETLGTDVNINFISEKFYCV